MVTGKKVFTKLFNSTALAVVEKGDPTQITIELEGAVDARNLVLTGTMVKVRDMACLEDYTPGLPHQGAGHHHWDHTGTGPSETTGMDAARTEAWKWT
jgi:hypothetical protein